MMLDDSSYQFSGLKSNIAHEKKLSKMGHLVMFLCFLKRKTHHVFSSKANRRTLLKGRVLV